MAEEARRVAVAFDGSPSAATAVRAAASLFRDARVSIATVPSRPNLRTGTAVPVLPGTSPDAVRRAVDELGAAARGEAAETAAHGVDQARALGLDAESVSVGSSAPAWVALLDAAHRVDAHVLVCGTRGRGAFARAVLGSTSASLLHHADLPLLVVPDGGGALRGPVMAAYDGSEASKRAIRVAGHLMSGRAAIVAHGWEPLSRRELAARAHAAGGPVDDLHDLAAQLYAALASDAAATAAEGVAIARAAGLDAVSDIVEADDGAWRALAAAARNHGAAVIAVGARGLGAARSALLGSVSSGLVQNAELPVLVVPDGDD